MTDIFSKMMSWGYEHGLKDIEHQIQKTIKQKRLVFLGENRVQYTDKQGVQKNYNFKEMVDVMIENGKWQKNMETLAISRENIKDILVAEYKKQIGGKK